MLALGLLLTGCSFVGGVSEDAVKAKTEAFINSDLLTDGAKATISSISTESGLYRIKVKLDRGGETREIDSFVSEDGRWLFPESPIEILTAEEKEAKAKEAAEIAKTDAATAVADLSKTDKPVVELFVMSHCPFGTQIEKGIIPVIETLGDKIDFQLKFVNYAMHAEKELREQIRQVAIRKNAPEKLLPYLQKFLEKDDSATVTAAIAAAGLDLAQLTEWEKAVDAEYKVMEKFRDQTTWTSGSYPPFDADLAQNKAYGVQGSPTLVINGKVVEGISRDSASLLTAICGAFTISPEACQAKLSTEAPTPGFGYQASADASAADGSCS